MRRPQGARKQGSGEKKKNGGETGRSGNDKAHVAGSYAARPLRGASVPNANTHKFSQSDDADASPCAIIATSMQKGNLPYLGLYPPFYRRQRIEVEAPTSILACTLL